MANALVHMDYDAFLELAHTPEGKTVTLNTNAALGLCRGNIVPTKAPLAWLALFWLALVSIPCIYFWSDLRFIAASIFLAWLGARRSKRSAIAAVWREVKGRGTLPYEQRAELYAGMVKNDWLHLPEPEENPFG